MNGKVFVDSNVLVYAHDEDAGPKQQRAVERLEELWDTGSGRMSTQVLQEFYVNVTRKIKQPLSPSVARDIIRNYSLWVEHAITPSTLLRASDISEAWTLSFWDSMIFASAEQHNAHTLLTEDMNHGQVIVGVRVVNPFL